jgi:hypothetical protein
MLLLSNTYHSRRSLSNISAEREVTRPGCLCGEDIAANEMWQETDDGYTDGLQCLLGNVLVFVMCSREAACFEPAVYYRSPTISGTVALYVSCLDSALMFFPFA